MDTFTTLIDPSTLDQFLDQPNWRIIDCRFSLADTTKGEQDYRQAHIPGALYAHLDRDLSGAIIPGTTGRHPLPAITFCEEQFSDWGIGPDTQVVIYDHSHGGVAARLWWMLQWLGHSKAAVLDGGWTAWKAAALPTEQSIPSITRTSFTAQAREDWIVDAAVVASMNQEESGLIDSRAAKRYQGQHEPIDSVAGHIPGAENYPFADNLNEEGRWKSKEELRQRFAALLAKHSAEELIFYCGSGVTACHNLLALQHAGLGEARLYPGSWSDWITDPDRAIVRKT